MYKRFIKRLLDFVLSLFGFILLSPFFIVIFLLLLFANRGKIFFMQPRPGLNERIFHVIKFKTMNDKRNKEGNLLPDGKRLTSVGRFLRKSSLDEIPQLLNVIKGDMSLVGPRPLLVEYLPYYTSREKLRHTVRPGITGWAQVNGRNKVLWNERLEMDVYYVEHLSFVLDFKIIVRTVINVFSGKDITVVPGSVVMKLNDERGNL